MNKLKWIIFAVLVIGIFGGIIWLGKSDTKTYTGDATKIITDGPIADHVLGSTQQKVVLIEYGDYECPGCGHMYSTVKEITDKHPEITFIFRNFPLTSLHPNALAAATAAEAAGKQNKYYEMHDLLYQSQTSWSQASVKDRSTIFENYAQQLGLDLNQYRQDLTSKDVTDKINRDINTGKTKFSAEATPTFVLNGKKVDANVAVDSTALTKLVEDAVKAALPGTNKPQQ